MKGAGAGADIDLTVAELFETVLHQTATQLQAKVPHDPQMLAQLEKLKSVRYAVVRTVMRMVPVTIEGITEQVQARNWEFLQRLAGVDTVAPYLQMFDKLPENSQNALIQRTVYLLGLLQKGTD